MTYFYIAIGLFLACSNPDRQESTDVSGADVTEETGAGEIETDEPPELWSDSLYFITKCDTVSSELLRFSRKRQPLTTFQKLTYVYCSPSAESQITDTLKFNTEIVSHRSMLRSYKSGKTEKNGRTVAINTAKEQWYEVNVDGKIGYLPEKALAREKLGNRLLFGAKQGKYNYQIVQYSAENRNEPVDSLELNRNHGYEIEPLIYNGLALCQGVIRYRDFRQSCPGTSTTTFIAVDTAGVLNKLLSSFNGTESSSVVYFPLKFGNGKTLLVADGNVNEIFNYHTASLNTFDISEGFEIPINRLIVEVRIEYAEEIEGLSADEIEITRQDTIYHRWNGNQLHEVQLTAGK